MKFCRDCIHLEDDEAIVKSYSMRAPNCLRPGRQILDMVSGLPMLSAYVPALTDRTCVHPGACGRDAEYFEKK